MSVNNKNMEGGSLPLAPKVAAVRQRFSAPPSAGDTPATPPTYLHAKEAV